MSNFNKFKNFLDSDENIKKLINEFKINTGQIELFEKIEKEFNTIKEIYPKYDKEIQEKLDYLFSKLSSQKARFFDFYVYPLNSRVRLMVSKQCTGYNDNININFDYIKSINELLFTLHQTIKSDEKFIGSIESVKEGCNKLGNDVFLQGKESQLSNGLFNLFKQLQTDIVNIISIDDNNVYIMVKGEKQALMIDVRINENDIFEVSYLIPRVTQEVYESLFKHLSGGSAESYFRGQKNVNRDIFIEEIYNIVNIASRCLYKEKEKSLKI